MKKMNDYNPIYDEIVNEVAKGIIKKGTNRDFSNYQLRIDNIESGDFTKDDLIALWICMYFDKEEASLYINDKIDKISKKVKNNEKIDNDETKFILLISEARNDALIIYKEMSNKSIYNIPESLRSKDIIINFMYYEETFEYIKNHIEEYDRQFFKDLIETHFILVNFEDRNIFSIMPLEYIDEEMCLLAFLNNGIMSGNWFREVYKRKPEVLTERLWKLAARFYVLSVQDAIDLIRVTPKEYKDYDFYQELCSMGSHLFGAKENVTDAIPPEILTPQFLLELILKESDNISSFSESALNTVLSYKKNQYIINENYAKAFPKTITITQKAWQMALMDNAINIWYVKPNDEKLKFFLRYYPEGTEEYNEYIVGEENIISEEKPIKLNSVTESDCNAIREVLRESKHEIARLPRKYVGEFFDNEKESETYMLEIYEKIGIIFDDNYDTVGPNNYLVLLPEGWKIIELDPLTYSLKRKLKIDQFLKKKTKSIFTLNNENGETVLEFSRTFDGENNNSFVETINYEKVEEAYEKQKGFEGFNK